MVEVERQLTPAGLEGFLQGRAHRAAAPQQPVGGQDGQVGRAEHRLRGGAVGRQGLPRLLPVHLGDERREQRVGGLVMCRPRHGANEEAAPADTPSFTVRPDGYNQVSSHPATARHWIIVMDHFCS